MTSNICKQKKIHTEKKKEEQSQHTKRIWSPRLTSPERSAGPPAKMKDINIPSPSSPPTILKPNPDGPRCRTTLRGSLFGKENNYN